MSSSNVRGGKFRKSSYSPGAPAGGCVEVAPKGDGGVIVRDSKLGDKSPELHFTSAEWEAFVRGVLDREPQLVCGVLDEPTSLAS